MALTSRTSAQRATGISPEMPRRKRLTSGWIAAAMLTFMMLINWADKSVLGLAAGPIMADLNLTPTQFGSIGSMFFLIFCLTPLVVGFIANRVSSQWLMAVLVLMWSVAQAPVLISASFATLLASRMILGAAEGPSASLMHRHLHKWFKPAERAMPSSVGASGSTLGLAIAAPILTFIIATWGWKEALLFMAVIGMIWVLIWAFVGKDGPLKTYEAAEGDSDEVVVEEKRVPYRRILTTGTWLGGALASHLAYWALTIYATWLPVYLTASLGLELREVGMIAAIPPLVGFGVFLASGAIVEFCSRRGITMRWSVGLQMGVTSVIAGLALLGAINAEGRTATVVFLAIAFGVPNSALSLVFLSGARIAPVRQRGAVFAFTNVAFTCAGIVAPLLIGIVIQRSADRVQGFEPIFLWLAVALVVASVVIALIVNPERDAIKLGLAEPVADPGPAADDGAASAASSSPVTVGATGEREPAGVAGAPGTTPLEDSRHDVAPQEHTR